MTARKNLLLSILAAGLLAGGTAACDGRTPSEPNLQFQPEEPMDTSGLIPPDRFRL